MRDISLHIDDCLSVIPDGKVITFSTLAKIFFTTPAHISTIIKNSIWKDEYYKVVPVSGKILLGKKQLTYLKKHNIVI
jgi:alkylated DNA nucleotide flippase Atl1